MQNTTRTFVFISILVFALNLSLYGQENEIKAAVKGEILIHYTSYDNAKRGKAILSEHSEIISRMNSLLKNTIKEAKPVCSHLIAKMTEKNLTEQEILKASYDKRVQKRGQGSYDFSGSSDFSRIILIRLTDTDRVEECVNILKNYSDDKYQIIAAEPNYLYKNVMVPNDSRYSEQWAHQNTDIEKAWDISTGSPEILIGVIDSGVDLFHEDLKDNISPLGYDFVNIDTNAYKTDYTFLIPGEDYVNPDNEPMDFGGHGTHVAGIIAAKGNNNNGVIGVAPNCTIVPLRAGFSINEPGNGGEQGYLQNDHVINAISYSITNGIDIINMSFGGSGESIIFSNTVKKAIDAGIVLVAAAGNNNSNKLYYPAAYNGVISVTATDSQNKRAEFTNYGDWVDVAAPGVFILSTVLKSGGALSYQSGYYWASGTSMAAPYIAGVAGLLLSKNPGLTPNKVKEIIKQNTDPVLEDDIYIGTGEINVNKVLLYNPLTSAYVSLISPQKSELITSSVEIKATITGTTYALYYGAGIYTKQWSLLDSGSITNTDYSYLLGPDGLSDGNFSIKIKTSDEYGIYETSNYFRVNNIAYESSLMPGFPVDMTGTINLAGDQPAPVVFDINRDGMNEIIVVSNGWVHVYNKEGKDIEGWPKYTGVSVSWYTPTIADLDNDGYYEILVVSSRSTEVTNDKNLLTIYDCSGNLYKKWEAPLFSFSWFKEPVTVDLDNNGYLNIILSDFRGFVYVYENDGTLLWKYQHGIQPSSINGITADDINKDGYLELLLLTYDQNFIILSHDGRELQKTFFYHAFGNIIAADLNADGSAEVIMPLLDDIYPNKQHGIIVIRPDGTKVFQTDLDFGAYNMAVGDINNDLIPEIIFVNRDIPNKIYALGNNGKVIDGWPQVITNGNKSFSNIGIINVDNDPEAEIYLGMNNGDIIIYNNDGSKYTMVNIPESANSVSIGDVDSDNIPELLCHSHDGKLFAWKISDVQTSTSSMDWGFYHHDIHQSSNLSYKITELDNYPPVLNTSSEYTIIEDDSLVIKKIAKDADNDIISLSCLYDSMAVTAKIDNNSIFLKPSPNYNGKTILSLIASDGILTDTCKLGLNVLSMNDSPYLQPLSDTTVFNYDTLVLKLNYFDIDKDSLSLSVSSNNDSVKVEIKDSCLYIVPIKRWTGKSLIKVIADDKIRKTESTFYYSLKDTVTTSVMDFTGIPSQYMLYQNYPNPFNPLTKIVYALPEKCYVSLRIYDISGKLIKNLLSGEMPAGYHTIIYTIGSEASGVYFYRLITPNYTDTKKFMILK